MNSTSHSLGINQISLNLRVAGYRLIKEDVTVALDYDGLLQGWIHESRRDGLFLTYLFADNALILISSYLP
jgi:hypothetical protein